MSDRIEQIRARLGQLSKLCGRPVGDQRCNLPAGHANQNSHEWHIQRPTIPYPDVAEVAELLSTVDALRGEVAEGRKLLGEAQRYCYTTLVRRIAAYLAVPPDSEGSQ